MDSNKVTVSKPKTGGEANAAGISLSLIHI